MGEVRALWRHPIKGHGREPLDAVDLTEGQTIPWGRRWAVAHELTQSDGTVTLGRLNTRWGHQKFGIYAVVTKGGKTGLGDRIEVL